MQEPGVPGSGRQPPFTVTPGAGAVKQRSDAGTQGSLGGGGRGAWGGGGRGESARCPLVVFQSLPLDDPSHRVTLEL